MSLPKKASASAIAARASPLVPGVDDDHGARRLDDLGETLRLDGRMDDELHAQGSFVGSGRSRRRGNAGRCRRAGRVDVELERPVRRPERVLDGLGGIRPREEEAEIARPLGERDQLLADVRADRHVLDPGDGERRLAAPHGPEHPGPRDGDHHDAGRLPLPLERVELDPERVPDDQLLQGQARPEAQRARAEAADRAGGHLDHPRPLVVDAELGVDRPLRRARAPAPPSASRPRSRAGRRQAVARASRRSSPRSTARRAGRACRRAPARGARPGPGAPRARPPGPGMKSSTRISSRPSPSSADSGGLEDRRDPAERRDERGRRRRPGSRRGCRRGSSA